MKTIQNLRLYAVIASFFLFIASSATSVLAQATEKVDVNINADGGSAWYASPWVWAIGVAVFIIIIVAITRGGNKSAA